MVMDDGDVAVCHKSVSSISHSKERMGKDEH